MGAPLNVRRSTREMISPTLSISVLTHVSEDANAHDLGQVNRGSRGIALTEIGWQNAKHRREWRQTL